MQGLVNQYEQGKRDGIAFAKQEPPQEIPDMPGSLHNHAEIESGFQSAYEAVSDLSENDREQYMKGFTEGYFDQPWEFPPIHIVNSVGKYGRWCCMCGTDLGPNATLQQVVAHDCPKKIQHGQPLIPPHYCTMCGDPFHPSTVAHTYPKPAN